MRGRLAALIVLVAVVHVPSALAGSIAVSTSLTPQPSRLGDVIHATLTVRAGGPATVAEGFSPFAIVRSTSSRTASGGITETTWRFDLPEATTMVAAQVIGNDTTITFAAQAGQLEARVEPERSTMSTKSANLTLRRCGASLIS